MMTKKSIKNLFRNIAKVAKPPPKLTVSQWADSYRQLSRETSAEAGQWNTDRAPYQREIMDSVNNADVEKVVIMSSAQVGKTEFLLNIVGYYIDYDPSPIMLVQPTKKEAEIFSKSRLDMMIRDTKTVNEKVASSKSRDGGNTTLYKQFMGGYIKLVGANTSKGLAGAPIRIVLMDEVDRFPIDVDGEGDPVSLAEKRTNNFWNKKKVLVSTPTLKGASKIESEYNNSTMEEWHVPCPSCGVLNAYEWHQIDRENVTMKCRHCGESHNQYEWKANQGAWLALHPDRKTRGFHLNEFASPWKKWEEIISDYYTAKKDTASYKAWVNTSLGLPYEDTTSEIEEDRLIKRREMYNCQVPDEVLLLTAGVDTQENRLECEVVGWGAGKESWGIQYKIFYGDPKQQEVWDKLDEYLNTVFTYEDGTGIKIATVCVDSGGSSTSQVYKFTKAREHRRIYSIKGKGGPGIPLIYQHSKSKKEGAILIILGVDDGKATIVSNLKLDYREEGDNSGYCHFPLDKGTGYNEEYFRGLLSEKFKKELFKGRYRYSWVKIHERNEPFDLRNYAQAAMELSNPDWNALRKKYKSVQAEEKPRIRAPVKKKKGTVSKANIW